MAEIEGMTDAQIEAAIKEMESQIRRERNEFTNAKKQVDDLNKRVKDNREKLKMNTQLPHMVANVGEILEPEEEEGGDKDGTGFQVKKVGGMDKKDQKK
jgi:26S proteasome regulatory subunit T5